MHILPRLPRRASPTTSALLQLRLRGNVGVVYRLVVWPLPVFMKMKWKKSKFSYQTISEND